MNKFKLFIILISISYIFMITTCAVSAEESGNNTVDTMLAQAEDFFVALKKGRYEAAWSLLSEKSHKTIIDDVYIKYQKMGGDIQRESIEQDFKKNGVIFNNYWDSFARNFDTLMVLEQSRWQAGVMEQNKADIIITYKASQNPLKLKMMRENDTWKVGLVETFWKSRSMDIFQSLLSFF